MDMGFRCGGHEELPRQHDAPSFTLLPEQLGELGIVRLDVADKPSEKPSAQSEKPVEPEKPAEEKPAEEKPAGEKPAAKAADDK